MRVLLLGEFSSLYKNLKAGLETLGCDVTTASAGDGYRKISSDIDLSSKFPGIIGRIHRKLKPLMYMRRFIRYDIVQVVNPFVFHHAFFPNIFFYKYIKNNNNKFFISAAGDDAFFWRYGRKRLKYGPFDEFLKYDLKSDDFFLMHDKSYRFNKDILSMSNGIIPIMYEYQVSYQHEEKCLDAIPIPVDMGKVHYQHNVIKDKIVIFHGLSRYGFKGTRHVEEAFNYLSKKYPSELELIIEGGLPLSDYLQLMSRTNIVIDQIHSHSLGVNGVYALAMGKIVIGGAEPESLRSHGVKDSPVINVSPNTESLIFEIEQLLLRKNDFLAIGKESRMYAESVHDHVNVARKYIELWSKN